MFTNTWNIWALSLFWSWIFEHISNKGNKIFKWLPFCMQTYVCNFYLLLWHLILRTYILIVDLLFTNIKSRRNLFWWQSSCATTWRHQHHRYQTLLWLHPALSTFHMYGMWYCCETDVCATWLPHQDCIYSIYMQLPLCTICLNVLY